MESASQTQVPVPDRPQIVQFDEADVQRHVSKEDLGVDTLIATELGAASHLEEKSRLVRSMIGVIGFDSLRYFAVRISPADEIERIYFMRNYLSKPRERFFEEGHYLYDARFAALMASNAACVWDVEQLVRLWRARSDPSWYRDWLAMLHADRKISGLAFALHVPGTMLRAVISLSSPNPDPAWITDSIVIQAFTLGLSVHQRCSAYVRSIDRPASLADLSDAQRHVLLLVVSGLSDKEIAARLGITPHAVDYHLRRLRDVFDAPNRTRLAFMAGRMRAV